MPKHKGPEILNAILVLILVPRSKAKVAMITLGINKIKKIQYQKAFFEKYNLEISSVGSLISYYYLYDVVDVNSYLDLSIEILQSMNAWIITEENYRRMSYLVYISQEPDIIAKFNYWHELYSEYFTN